MMLKLQWGYGERGSRIQVGYVETVQDRDMIITDGLQ